MVEGKPANCPAMSASISHLLKADSALHTRDAVEKKDPAVEETSHGGLFLRLAAPPKIDAT